MAKKKAVKKAAPKKVAAKKAAPKKAAPKARAKEPASSGSQEYPLGMRVAGESKAEKK